MSEKEYFTSCLKQAQSFSLCISAILAQQMWPWKVTLQNAE